ncbi:hypothetical protein NL108_011287 [Boleophthalmus pectinirostris]|nr:hypothetical protein NL108_011287 [Boleophthalmus pectinirostris]
MEAGSEQIRGSCCVFVCKMCMCYVVYGCANRSNREKEKQFFRVPNTVVHKGQKWEKLTEKHHKKWITNLRLQSGGNARVRGDHSKVFYKDKLFFYGLPKHKRIINA